MGKVKRDRPSISFDQCYLSVYESKAGLVYMTKELYSLMGRPARILFTLMGRTVVLSPARKYGLEVAFNTNGQPFVHSLELSKAIGPGHKAYYSYDESDYDIYGRGGKRTYFYFRISSDVVIIPKPKPIPPDSR